MTIDAKSGVSGAGRSADERHSYVNLTENFMPYATDGHRHLPEIEQELRRLGVGVDAPISFVPHLLPVDQGLLASCYVELASDVEADELASLYSDYYAGETFVEVVATPPGVREVRDTNLCRIHPVEARGRAGRDLRGDRQPVEGGRGAGDPEPQPDAGVGRGGGIDLSPPSAVGSRQHGFLRSRWVRAPAGVEELDPARLAPGFRAAGAACGLKEGGEVDVGLVVCDADPVESAILLTRNAAAAAPVRVCREQCDADAIRAAIVNSGNANAATGARGYRDALAIRDAAATAVDAVPRAVAVAETGVIGVPLPVDDVVRGVDGGRRRCSPPTAPTPSRGRS